MNHVKCRTCGLRRPLGPCPDVKAPIERAGPPTPRKALPNPVLKDERGGYPVDTASVTTTIRLPQEVMSEVDAMAKRWDDTRSRALRRLIQVGLAHA